MNAIVGGDRDQMRQECEPLVAIGRAGRRELERHAIDELHHVERGAVGEPTGGMEWHDAGMAEPCGDRGLAFEPAHQASAPAIVEP